MKVKLNTKTKPEIVSSIINDMISEDGRFYRPQGSKFGYSNVGDSHVWLTSGGARFTLNTANNTATFVGRRHALQGRWFDCLKDCDVIEYVTHTPHLPWWETNYRLSTRMDIFIKKCEPCGNIITQLLKEFTDRAIEEVRHLFYMRLKTHIVDMQERLKAFESLQEDNDW